MKEREMENGKRLITRKTLQGILSGNASGDNRGGSNSEIVLGKPSSNVSSFASGNACENLLIY